MLKKILASLGKGAATVDLQFADDTYQAGGTIQGEVMIHGGEVTQKINKLSIRLMMNVALKQQSVSREIATISLISRDRIHPKEEKVIPFHYVLPTNIPISSGTVSYHFDTHLDIEGGIDRKDVDQLIIEPHESIGAIFQAMDQLGFRETSKSGTLDKYGQEFAFVPTEQFLGQVNEVELRFAMEDSGIRVWMEVDCKNGFKEIEAKRELQIKWSILENEAELEKLLCKYILETVDDPYAYGQPFSYSSQSHHYDHGHGTSDMIGGLAIGVLGAMLVEEIIDELFEDEDEEYEDENTFEDANDDSDFSFDDGGSED